MRCGGQATATPLRLNSFAWRVREDRQECDALRRTGYGRPAPFEQFCMALRRTRARSRTHVPPRTGHGWVFRRRSAIRGVRARADKYVALQLEGRPGGIPTEPPRPSPCSTSPCPGGLSRTSWRPSTASAGTPARSPRCAAPRRSTGSGNADRVERGGPPPFWLLFPGGFPEVVDQYHHLFGSTSTARPLPTGALSPMAHGACAHGHLCRARCSGSGWGGSEVLPSGMFRVHFPEDNTEAPGGGGRARQPTAARGGGFS